MQAIVQTEYGPSEVLSIAEVALPAPKANEVLVKVRAAGVHAGDWHLMRGTPFLVRLIFGGLRQPKITTIGTDMAGIVEAVGSAVKQFQPGDDVFGDLSECGFGAFAEYVAVPEVALAIKPRNVSFEAAATVPVSAMTALQALRDVGQVQAGQRVLINGASGGVGSFAVQIAKAFGAEVTAVCRTEKMAMVRSLGADHIIDYTQTDCTKTGERYDLILDAAAYRSVLAFLPRLKPQGTYVMIGGETARIFQVMLFGPIMGKIKKRNVKFLAQKPNPADLVILRDMIESGKIIPVVDRTYPLSEVAAAIDYVETRQVQGKVAIRI
ncbi:MAG: NAD(P)-dependent alcohol dehydrogenase [Thermosynechococcaceae cyanobacterium]